MALMVMVEDYLVLIIAHGIKFNWMWQLILGMVDFMIYFKMLLMVKITEKGISLFYSKLISVQKLNGFEGDTFAEIVFPYIFVAIFTGWFTRWIEMARGNNIQLYS